MLSLYRLTFSSLSLYTTRFLSTFKNKDVPFDMIDHYHNTSNENSPLSSQTIPLSSFRKNFTTPLSPPVPNHASSPSPLSTSNSSQIFVSQHYQADVNDISSYLHRKKFVFSNKTDKFCIKECPFCPPTKGKTDNMWKLYIFKNSGQYYCHRCSNQGSWFDFKREMGDGAIFYDTAGRPIPVQDSIPKPDQLLMKTYLNNLFLPEYQSVLDWFSKERMITFETLKHYHCGCCVHTMVDEYDQTIQEKCLVFLWTKLGEQGVMYDRYKVRSLRSKSRMLILPSGGLYGFFGWHTIPNTADTIVITEGEIDAMSVYQETKLPTISLPNGAASLPLELLPILERFKKIYLWMDDDIPGQQGAEKFAKKLGYNRCFLVHCPKNIISSTSNTIIHLKDANDCLRHHVSFKECLDKSVKISHSQILTFSEMKDEVLRQFTNSDEISGVKFNSIPGLNKLLKGHRKGELTILSGNTGVGKTTLLSQLSLDLCKSNVCTLWGSFEIKNIRLCATLLSQFANVDFSQNIELFSYHSNRFEALPLYFLRFFGSTEISSIVDAMDYAVYVLDVDHILLDNLQFMVGMSNNPYTSRFEIQDQAFEVMRNFASSKNIHITMVVHPRKESVFDSLLNINSVFGSAKSTQEADNVILLQNIPGANFKIVEVCKNRFDGSVGQIPIIFNKKSKSYEELSKDEFSKIKEKFLSEQEEKENWFPQNASSFGSNQKFKKNKNAPASQIFDNIIVD